MREPNDPQMGWHDRGVQKPLEEEDAVCRSGLNWQRSWNGGRQKLMHALLGHDRLYILGALDAETEVEMKHLPLHDGFGLVG